MAHFIGKLQGSRGSASRLGTKSSGINASAQGWEIGGTVAVHHINGKDVVTFYLSSGSNNRQHGEYVGHYTLAPDGSYQRCTADGESQ